MRATSIKIYDLFQTQKRYIIPLFQRPYVWQEDAQWKPLWKDVIDKADEVAQYGTNSSYSIRKHFLGAVVISQIRVSVLQIAAMDVIDGQQRITTLQVLLYALRDYTRAIGGSLVHLDLITENSTALANPNEKYKVWPTTSDRDDFEEVAHAGSPDQLESLYPLQRLKYTKRNAPRPRLVESYLFFHKAISTYCNDTFGFVSTTPNPVQERLGNLLMAITEYLEVVAIELETGDDPQVIFETLNARGVPLLPSDLIRNFVFLEATKQGKNVDNLYRTYWHDFDNDHFWTQEQVQGRFKRQQLDLFIFHYLTSRTQREIPIKLIYAEFHDWWIKNCPDVQAGLQELQATSQQYHGLIKPQGQSQLSVFCDRLQALDVGPAYPVLLLLTVHQKQKVASGELPGILTDMESYLVRRMVCGFTPKNYNNLFVQILEKLNALVNIDRASFRSILTGFQGLSGEWPTDQQFKQAWLNEPMYEKLTAQRLMLVLKALDLQLMTAKQEQIHLSGSLSIEHVMPQTRISGDYPYYRGGVIDYSPSKDQIEKRERLIHTIGNLTLLTQPLNSSVKNSAFSIKQPEIQQSLLVLNLYFRQHYSATDAWAEEDIQRRGELLFQTALQIWPHP